MPEGQNINNLCMRIVRVQSDVAGVAERNDQFAQFRQIVKWSTDVGIGLQ